jgi:nitrilase
MGFWRWLHDASVRHAIGKDRRSDLLGKLFALNAGSHVRKRASEIYCTPTADARDSWIASVRHIAVEKRCFVLSCNQFNLRRGFPDQYRSGFGDDPHSVVNRDGSCVVDPFGKFLAGPNLESEAILIAEMDRTQIVRGKFDLDVVGRYARPDIFQLHVDERPKQPVTTKRSEANGAGNPTPG